MINTLSPVFDDEAVTVVFSTGENFAPFCSAAVLSLLDHASPKRCYDIIILDTDMKYGTKDIYRQLLDGYHNISIRFYNVSEILGRYIFGESAQWTVDCYGRLLIPDMLPDYKKAIYLDSDQIVMADVAELFDTDMPEACIGAFPHVGIAADLNGFDRSPGSYKYFTEKVGIKEGNLPNIFMSSTLLMNLERIRGKFSYHQLLEYAQEKKFRILDMDVLNSLFQDDIKLISQAWGWYAATEDEPVGRRFAHAPQKIYDEYIAAGAAPKIIHFAGMNKPWEVLGRVRSEEFWRVFRRTPFYAGFMEQQLLTNKSQLDSYKKQADEANRNTAELRANLDTFENKESQLFARLDELASTIAELRSLSYAHQSWMDRVRFSLPYRIVRKIRGIFRKPS